MKNIADWTTEEQMALCFTLAYIIAIVTILVILFKSYKA